MRLFRTIAAGAAALILAACGGSPGRAGAPPSVVWLVYRHLPGVVDLAGPRGDGSFLVAAAGRLFVLGRDGTLSPFARGAGGYRTATGTEPYLVLAGSDAVRGTSCSFGNGTAFALEPGPRPGVVMISPQGRARRFASLPPGRFLSGIAFDSTGRFGHRLLVTAGSGGRTTVFGIGCDGRLSVIAAGAPAVEGGITVAPAAFGRFGGDLIAADEASGRVYAVDPAGQVITLAQPALPLAATSAWSPPGSCRSEQPSPTLPIVSRRATSTQATMPSCSCPRRNWRKAESGPATCSSLPKAAPRPSTSAARPRAHSGTLPPDRRLRTPKGTLSSHRRKDAKRQCRETYRN